MRKKFLRKQLLHFTANPQVELVGMEACGGSHFLGRVPREEGYEVRLMSAQYVKPDVKTRCPAQRAKRRNYAVLFSSMASGCP